MHTIGIKELQTNPGKLTKSLVDDEYLLITRRGQPLGIALPFTEKLMENGLKPWMALKAFQEGDLSLGQLSAVFNKNKIEMIETLATLNIPLADYDLDEDLQSLDKLFPV